MKSPNLSGDKMNALLSMAGKKLGKSPEEIRSQAQSGNLDALTEGLDPKVKAQINGLLNDPKALESLLKNEQLQILLGGLGKK